MDIRHEERLELLISRYKVLEPIYQDILDAYQIMEQCFLNNGKLLVVGNGGSAADAQHIVGELMKSFVLRRQLPQTYREKLCAIDQELGIALADKLEGALPAISLEGSSTLMTAWMNDTDPALCFAQQVNGLGNPQDILLCISTSGNSRNVLYAAVTAKAKGMKVIGLTGANKSKLQSLADLCVMVPAQETYLIQELHLPIYHCWCLMLEQSFFGTDNNE